VAGTGAHPQCCLRSLTPDPSVRGSEYPTKYTAVQRELERPFFENIVFLTLFIFYEYTS
jgi:hypothetical protein